MFGENAKNLQGKDMNIILTNQFNEQSMVQLIQKRLKANYAAMLQERLIEDTRRRRTTKKRAHEHKHTPNTAESAVSAPSEPAAENTFFEHYDILQVISFKCIAAVCNKVRKKRFMLKKITKQTLELQRYINEEIK